MSSTLHQLRGVDHYATQTAKLMAEPRLASQHCPDHWYQARVHMFQTSSGAFLPDPFHTAHTALPTTYGGSQRKQCHAHRCVIQGA
ncbi:MAG: hypothetical protein AAFS10_09520 [Myxococcota bacterium]